MRDPWHVGERALQDRLGVAERMAELGPRVIRDFMPEQHREFFAELSFVLLASVDDRGDAWAGVLVGEPGSLASSPDPRTLALAGRPDADDPVGAGLRPGAAIGLLGIELDTRRRNRMNGTIRELGERGLTIAVEQSFGNCPKYIHPRGASRVEGWRPGPVERFVGLDARARESIAAADTSFVASYFEAPGGVRRQVDVSHRGGPAGFVRVEADTLTIPDYAGNRFFNTLGNIAVQPKVGLLFIDFASGDLLQVTGDAALIFAGDPRLAGLAGAERAWTLRVRLGVRRANAIPLRWVSA
ncbi:pyridoxamine 5'-phosphate oxidase family protein [Nannocystaceae bacterium ST9]